MKVKDARTHLEGLSGDILYQQARKLFEEETEIRIRQRTHEGRIRPTQGLVQSVVEEMGSWFLSIAKDLSWTKPDIPEKIIEWGTGQIWIRYKLLDPRIKRYKERVQRAKMRGSPNPLLETLTSDALNAVSSMMLAQIVQAAQTALDRMQAREEAAKKMGLKVCLHEADARFCPHQKDYVLDEVLPTNVDQIAFLCTLKEDCPYPTVDDLPTQDKEV